MGLSETIKTNSETKVKNKHNITTNHNWLEADQLVISKE